MAPVRGAKAAPVSGRNRAGCRFPRTRLTPRATEALEGHLRRQLRDVEILGDSYGDRGLVFATSTGAPVNPSNLRKRSFAPLLEKANLPRIRFHNLRHTCATLLLAKGTHPEFVQELLGHATVAVTLDTYSHVIPSMGDQTARHAECALPHGGRAYLTAAALVSERAGASPALLPWFMRLPLNMRLRESGPAWTRTMDLFLIREARRFSGVFLSSQISCK
jgi:Phage integrase family